MIEVFGTVKIYLNVQVPSHNQKVVARPKRILIHSQDVGYEQRYSVLRWFVENNCIGHRTDYRNALSITFEVIEAMHIADMDRV